MSQEQAVQQMMQHIQRSLPTYMAAMWAAAELGIPDVLGDEPMRSEELARRAHVDPDALARTLRLLAGYGTFREVAPGTYEHTDRSLLLRSDHPQSVRAFVRLTTTLWKMVVLLPETLRTGRPAASMLARGGIFEYFGAHPDEARIFNEAMTSKAHADITAVLDAYDCSDLHLIADVGGGRGHFIKAILDRYTGAKGILFDLPQVLKALSETGSERLKTQPGDFFRDALPGCDAYLLMNVLHDWSDEEVRRILAAVRRAAPAHAKLLVIETVMPEQPEPGPEGAHLAVLADVLMLLSTGGCERSRSQYETLFRKEGFRLRRVIPTASERSVLECTL